MSDLAYRVELTPPDIEQYRAGNTGIDYVTSFVAGEPGPHVVVTALTHGNEICGAIALDRVLRAQIRPRRGKLTLAFDNVAAYREFDPRYPIASRYVDEDFNRLWSPATLDGPRRSVELERARALRPIIEDADFLLDLHSMQYATAPLMLAGLLPRSRELARRVGIPELIMCDEGHAAGPRMRDYGGFGDPASEKIAGERFDFTADFRGLEVLPDKGTLIGRDGGKEVRTPYDNCVLIMPSRRLVKGQTAVRLGRYLD